MEYLAVLSKDHTGDYNNSSTTKKKKPRRTLSLFSPAQILIIIWHINISHTDADGKIYTVHYEADDNGYRATGQHLPVLSQVKTEQTGAATVIHMTPVMPTFPYAYPLAPFPPLVYNIPHSYTYTF